MEGLARQVQQDRGVLADAVEQNGALEGGGRLRKTQMASASRASSTREVSWSIDMWLISLRRRARDGRGGVRGRPPTHCCMHELQAVSLATASSSIT